MEAPVEIQTVKDNANFKVCNKNIVNIQPFTLKGGTNNYTGRTFNFSIKAGTYTIQRKFTKSDNAVSNAGMVQIFADNVNIKNIDAPVALQTITVDKDVDLQLRFFLNTTQTTTEESSIDFYDIQIEKGSTATEYVANEEQNYTVDVQEEMLEGDYFDLENGKEVHTWLYLVLDGTTNVVTQSTTNTEGKHRYTFALWGAFRKSFLQCDTTNNKAYCSHLKLTGPQLTYGRYSGFTVASNVLYIYTDGATADEFNEYLKTNPMTFYIPFREDYYNKLNLTDNQKTQLEALKKVKTYKNITNIYSTDEVGAIIKVDYKKDLETLVNNINNTLLGGN